jgi:hypothetical protein
MTMDKKKNIIQMISLFFLIVDCLLCSLFFFMTTQQSKYLMTLPFRYLTYYYRYLPFFLVILGGTSLIIFAMVLYYNYYNYKQNALMFFQFLLCFVCVFFFCTFNFYFATLCKMNWLFILSTHVAQKPIPLILPYVPQLFHLYLVIIICFFLVFSYILLKFFQFLINVQNLKQNLSYLYKIFILLVYLLVPILLFYLFFYSFCFFLLWYYQQLVVDFELLHFHIIITNINEYISIFYNLLFSCLILLYYLILACHNISLIHLLFSESEKMLLFKKSKNIFIYFFVLIPIILIIEYTLFIFIYKSTLMFCGLVFNFIFKINSHFNFINNFCLVLTKGFLGQHKSKITMFIFDDITIIYTILGCLTLIIVIFSLVYFYSLKKKESAVK